MMAGRVPAGPVEVAPRGFVPEAEQAAILDDALAGMSGSPWRVDHAPNAKGNFCFEVTLGYRRLERGR